MKVISVVQQKGGVGKSTLTLNLALFFASQGANVGIVDADPQGSLRHSADALETVSFIPLSDFLAGKFGKLNLVMIDTSPRNDDLLSEILQASDFVLMPVKPGYFDVLALKDTVALLTQARAKKPTLKAGIVFNMVQHRSAVTRDIASIIEMFDVELLETYVYNRVIYTRSAITSGILEGEDEKAKAELLSLATEIYDRL